MGNAARFGTALAAGLVLAAGAAHAAGTVRLVQKGSKLALIGDAAGNSVVIQATDTAGDLHVKGLAGTLVGFDGALTNGGATVPVSGVEHIAANLGAGDNELLLTALGPDGEQPELLIAGKFSFRSGSGNDIVVFDNTRMAGKVALNLGDGADTVVGFECSFESGVGFTTGNGDDAIAIQLCDLTGKMKANMALGEDRFVALDASFAGKASLVMGGGDDRAGLANAPFASTAKLDGGKDDDTFLDDPNAIDDYALKSFENVTGGDEDDVVELLTNLPGISRAVDLIVDEGTNF
jgi:hypothetical protein